MEILAMLVFISNIYIRKVTFVLLQKKLKTIFLQKLLMFNGCMIFSKYRIQWWIIVSLNFLNLKDIEEFVEEVM